MPDELTAKLVVMDTGPLITLAAAGNLDYLLRPGVPVYIPDAVLYEATRDGGALGAPEILAWTQAHEDGIRTVSTETFFNYVENRRLRDHWRERDLGERAALEAIHDAIHLSREERAVLITEDDRVLRRVLVTEAELTARIIPVTTRDFLVALEEAGWINSVDEVYRRAEDVGRLASRRTVLKDKHEQALKAVALMMRRDLK